MSKARDEQIKLTATFLNGVAIAMGAVGGIAPLAAVTYGVPGSATFPATAVVGLGWLAGAVVLHLIARRSLRRLKE